MATVFKNFEEMRHYWKNKDEVYDDRRRLPNNGSGDNNDTVIRNHKLSDNK